MWYPGAIRKEIRKFRTPIRTQSRAFILHVAVSEADSLYGYFSGAAVASHFYVRKNGIVEQYVDTRYQAPANLYANSTAISVETQGGVRNANSEPWTDAQLKALAQLSKWLHETHDIPLQVMKDSRPSTRGIGYHRLGVDPYRVSGGELWSSAYGKICPGQGKINQVDDIVAMSKGTSVPRPPVQPSQPAKNYLEYGDKGTKVKNLQRLLNVELPDDLKEDGVFGTATRTSVRKYQSSRGLIIDGIAGPATLGALQSHKKPVPRKPKPDPETLNLGDIGDDVKELQRTLNAKFPSYSRLVVDGIFGKATEAVVEEFQRRHPDLDPTGDYGPKTRRMLELAKPEKKPIKVINKPKKLKITGYLGPATITKWQEELGAAPTGKLDKATVKAIQSFLRKKGFSVGKSGVDGIMGPDTITALQKYLGTVADGEISRPSPAIKELQRRLNAGKF